MTEAGSVYGQALYDLAAEENLTKTILDQLSMLQHCFTVEEPQFLKLLSSPNLYDRPDPSAVPVGRS